jgi:hypothetical protein
MSGAASGSTLASLWPDAGLVRPWWAKQRIIAAKGASLYELTLAGGAALPAAIFTHPDSNWTWTAVAEAPDCILAAGYSNGTGSIFAFNLVTSGTASGTPTLDQGVQVAEFPTGEEVTPARLPRHVRRHRHQQGCPYRHPRCQREDAVRPADHLHDAPVRDLAARDHYVYAAIEADIDGGSGCARIDLAEEINAINSAGYVTANSQRYAWAYDAQSHTTGAVYSVTFLGGTDRVVLAVNPMASTSSRPRSTRPPATC